MPKPFYVLALLLILATVLTLLIMLLLGWRNYQKHRMLLLEIDKQARSAAKVIHWLHPQAERRCDRAGTALVVLNTFCVIAMMAVLPEKLARLTPWQMVRYGALFCVTNCLVSFLPWLAHAAGARAHWWWLCSANASPTDELLAQFWACDLAPEMAKQPLYLRRKMAQPYCLGDRIAEQKELLAHWTQLGQQMDEQRKKLDDLRARHAHALRKMAVGKPTDQPEKNIVKKIATTKAFENRYRNYALGEQEIWWHIADLSAKREQLKERLDEIGGLLNVVRLRQNWCWLAFTRGKRKTTGRSKSGLLD